MPQLYLGMRVQFAGFDISVLIDIDMVVVPIDIYYLRFMVKAPWLVFPCILRLLYVCIWLIAFSG